MVSAAQIDNHRGRGMDQKLLRILGGNIKHYPIHLESQYPRVFGKIMSLWDSPEINDYFMELMVDKRGGRAGFPPEVASEIMHLNLVNTTRQPLEAKRDPWDPSETLAHFDHWASSEESGVWVEPLDAIKNAIQQSGASCSVEGFLHAAESCNRPVVALFLDAHTNIETRNENGWTPLMLAAFNGCDEVVGYLIQQGAHVQARDSGGNTALHWAAFAGHTASAKLLIENHAEVDARSSFGLTPLQQAVARHHLKVVLLLISRGANLNSAANDGWTALHKAAAMGYTEIVWPLVHNGANINIKNLDGDTPIKLAIKNKQEAVVRVLTMVSETDNAGGAR